MKLPQEANMNARKTETLGDRINQTLEKRNISQRKLAAMVGISQQSINYLIKPRTGVEAESKHTAGIAEALGVSARWLATGEGSVYGQDVIRTTKDRQVRRIPLIPRNAASLHREYTFRSGEEADVITDVGSDESFGMLIDDISNTPVLQVGDYVVVDPKVNPKPGQFVVVFTKVGTVVRKYRPRTATDFELTAMHPDHPMFTSNDGSVPTIIGPIVESRRYW